MIFSSSDISEADAGASPTQIQQEDDETAERLRTPSPSQGMICDISEADFTAAEKSCLVMAKECAGALQSHHLLAQFVLRHMEQTL